MRYFKYFPLVLLLSGSLYLWDASQRYKTSIYCPSPKELQAFSAQDSLTDIKQLYRKHFHDSLFRFPRRPVSKVILTKNIPFISRFTSHELSAVQTRQLLHFLNQPENFTWQTATMRYAQAEYIIYFYDDENRLTGKLWLCLSCGQLKAVPFSPAMKFMSIRPDKLGVLKKLIR